jgi:hypothetical protein
MRKPLHQMNDEEIRAYVIETFKKSAEKRGHDMQPNEGEITFLTAEFKRLRADMIAMLPTAGGIQ